MELQTFLDNLSTSIYGMKRSDAHNQGICLRCKKPPTFQTQEGREEYNQSGLCEPCFDHETEDL